MAYSLDRITSKSECDALIRLAQEEKDTLAFRIISFERQQKNYQERSIEVLSELQTVKAEITALETVLAALPDGDAKDDQRSKKRKAEARLILLEERQGEFGIIALIEVELNLTRARSELAQIDDFIAQTEARKAQLPA